MGRVLRYYQIFEEESLLMKIRKNKLKWKFPFLVIRDIQNLPLVVFGMTNAMKLVKTFLCITKDIKIQDGPNYDKKSLVLGIRWGRETQILIFNSTHLVSNANLIANCLSFHISLVVVINCGAGNALSDFEISMF